ncbi:uncharacterized protein [Phaseolus vulgaris]|uniref:C2 domain-containing protein n=1 Tax=Phaseolus vulgaris TaxID=3885 RepID=V7CZW1_PHAVU|nr:hypothetical protein PHAVU_001G251900g [Phaseolus vulgaris]ESW35639.1 hypothetical protein PHAVU_001G251900g [Phaseolus vulgaris]
MDHSHRVSSFSCELRIVQAKNVESMQSTKNLFARLYLPAGTNKRIQLNTKKVSYEPFWNESFSLDCSCPREFLESLWKERVVLELRQSKMWGSQVVAKGEIPWKAILESPKMELKEWVKMDLVRGSDDADWKAPQVEVEIKIVVEKESERRKRMNKKWDECGCKEGHDLHACCSVDDYAIYVL